MSRQKIHSLLAMALCFNLASCGALYDPEGFGNVATSGFEKDPTLTDAAFGALAKGDYSRAESTIDIILKRNNRDPYGLLACGILYQNTGRPQKAKQCYEELMAQKPNLVATVSPWQRLGPKSVMEIASANMAALEGGGLARSIPEPMGLAPVQPLPASVPGARNSFAAPGPQAAIGGVPAPKTKNASSVPYKDIGKDTPDSNAIYRFLVVKQLAEDGLITNEEYRARRASNVGILLPYTSPAAGAGLDRPVPPADQIISRLQSLAQAFEMRAITPSEHSLERSMILDALLPSNPKFRLNPPPPASGMLEAAALVGRLERLRENGLISQEEMNKERQIIENHLQTVNGGPPPGAVVQQGETKPNKSKSKTSPTATTNNKGRTLRGGSEITTSMGIHLASFKTQEQAEAAWKDMKAKHGDVLGKFEAQYAKADLGPGKGIYYRIKIGPVGGRAEAGEICNTLKARKQFCEITFME